MRLCITNRLVLLGSVDGTARSRLISSNRVAPSLTTCGLAWRTRSTGAQNRRLHVNSQQESAPGSGGVFKPAESEEEWLQLDEKVNEYPTSRTFKAIGSGGQEFAELMVTAVEKATTRAVDRRIQVVKRPSKEGKYLSVSIRSVSVDSGRQVLDVFREMKSSGGRQLKFII